MPRAATINWERRGGVNKQDLIDGLHDWIRQKTGIADASLSYVHQLTIDDLTVIAMATGYRPPAHVEQNLLKQFRWKAEAVERDRAKWEARSAGKTTAAKVLALPAPEKP